MVASEKTSSKMSDTIDYNVKSAHSDKWSSETKADTMGFLPPVFSAHMNTWGYMWAYWNKDKDTSEKCVSKLTSCFIGVTSLPVAANLFLNVVSFNLAFLAVLPYAGFSREFFEFCLKYMCTPQILGNVAYLIHRFGISAVLSAFSPSVILSWLHNIIMVAAVGLMSVEISVVFLSAAPYIEYVLPQYFVGEFGFPIAVKELYFMRAHMAFMCFAGVLFVTLPLWMKGYVLNMKVAGRPATLGYFELAMDLLYFSVNWSQLYQFFIPLGVIMELLGFRFLIVHYLIAIVEFALISMSLQLKFDPIHQLMHRVPALYRMTHLEHHVCRTIHPTSSSAGVWEMLAYGGTPLFSAIQYYQMPWVPFFMVNFGSALLVHTMWPHEKLVQWHTMHHVVLADIYAGNVPSAWDKLHSKDIKKYKATLEKSSLFVQTEWLSDAAGFWLSIIFMALFHYGLGWSIFAVWDQRYGANA